MGTNIDKRENLANEIAKIAGVTALVLSLIATISFANTTNSASSGFEEIDKIFQSDTSDNNYWNEISGNIADAYKHEWYIMPSESDIHTFYLLQQFEQFIISNSTFIWWCVWLSNAKQVIAPKHWFGPGGPSSYEDIYESSWIRM